MIKSFINKVVVDIAGFKCLSEDDSEYVFYQRIDDQNRRRYLVITESERLCESEEYNEEISNCTPNNIANLPAFDKNTDLIILLDIKESENFIDHEKDIFSIEENPYNYKKYVLYTTAEERRLLNESLFIKNSCFTSNEFTDFLENRKEFEKYKENPYNASLYGVIVKMHIKLPFLKIAGASKEKISNVNEILQLKLNEEQISDSVETILKLSEKDDLEKAIKDYINE